MRYAPYVVVLTLASGVLANCSKSDSSTDAAGSTGATHTPTNVVVTWTFAGKPATAAECMTRKGAQVYVNLSGTVDTSLHQTQTVPCATGTVTFSGPTMTVESLGTPDLEGTLLDDMAMTVTTTDAPVMPTPVSTKVNIDFFAVGAGGAGGASSTMATTAATTAATTTSGGGMGGAGGASATTAASSTAASSTAASSTVASSSSSGGGPKDAGSD